MTFPNRTVQPHLQGGPLKDKYIFEQMHFHWADHGFGSEHVLDGNTAYSMEVHLVHYNSKYQNFEEAASKPDGLAVAGFLIQAVGDEDLEEFSKITNGLARIQTMNSKSRLAADCLAFLKLQELGKHYYTYQGSLTTPPYFESVTWIVYRTPIYVSMRQVAVFRNLLDADGKQILYNYRDVQEPKVKPRIIFSRNVLKSKL